MNKADDQKSRKRALSAAETHDPPENRRYSQDLRSIFTLSPLPSPIMTPTAQTSSAQTQFSINQPPTFDEDTHMMAASPALPNMTMPETAEMLEVDKALKPLGETTTHEDPFTVPTQEQLAERKTQHLRHKTKQARGKDANHQARLHIGPPDSSPTTQPHPKPNQTPQPPTTKPMTDAIHNPPSNACPAPQGPITSMPILPRHPLPQATNGVVTIGDFKFTEYPRNMPHLYPQLGCNILLHHQSEQIIQWESKENYKVLVREFRAKFETNVEARRATRSLIEETIAKFLNEDASFVLSDPKINSPVSRARIDPPWHTLVYKLTKPQYEKLLAHPIIATPSGVIIISPLQQIIPTYIASITGITCRGNSEEGRRIVTGAVRKGLLSSVALADDFDQIAGAGSYQKVIEGLNVYFVSTSDARPNDGWWNVESSGMPRHITIEQYRALADRIKSLTFPTDDNGDGVALKKSRECMNCKSITHTVQTCTLYRMPGWLGPPKEETEQENTGTRPVRGKGQRGRGGRGGAPHAMKGPRGFSGRG